jgi:tetratricopeptide (TPR) repeat protein
MAAAAASGGDQASFSAAAMMVALPAVAGAVGGWIHEATERRRNRGGLRAAISWFATFGTTLLVLATLGLIMLTRLGLEGNAAYRVWFLTSRPVVVALLASTAIVAVVAAKAEDAAGHSDEFFTLATWGFLFLMFFSTRSFFGEPSWVPLAEDRATAERVLQFAADEARRSPRSARAQFALGVAHGELDQHAQAVAPLTAAIQLDPDQPWPRNRLGWTLNQIGDFAAAIPHLEAAVRLDESYEMAFKNLGWANMRLSRWEPSERAYRQALRVDPDDASARSQLAWVLLRRGKDSLALVETFRSLALDANDVWTHDFAARLLHARNRSAEAQAHSDTAAMLRQAGSAARDSAP